MRCVLQVLSIIFQEVGKCSDQGQKSEQSQSYNNILRRGLMLYGAFGSVCLVWKQVFWERRKMFMKPEEWLQVEKLLTLCFYQLTPRHIGWMVRVVAHHDQFCTWCYCFDNMLQVQLKHDVHIYIAIAFCWRPPILCSWHMAKAQIIRNECGHILNAKEYGQKGWSPNMKGVFTLKV